MNNVTTQLDRLKAEGKTFSP